MRYFTDALGQTWFDSGFGTRPAGNQHGLGQAGTGATFSIHSESFDCEWQVLIFYKDGRGTQREFAIERTGRADGLSYEGLANLFGPFTALVIATDPVKGPAIAWYLGRAPYQVGTRRVGPLRPTIWRNGRCDIQNSIRTEGFDLVVPEGFIRVPPYIFRSDTPVEEIRRMTEQSASEASAGLAVPYGSLGIITPTQAQRLLQADWGYTGYDLESIAARRPGPPAPPPITVPQPPVPDCPSGYSRQIPTCGAGEVVEPGPYGCYRCAAATAPPIRAGVLIGGAVIAAIAIGASLLSRRKDSKQLVAKGGLTSTAIGAK